MLNIYYWIMSDTELSAHDDEEQVEETNKDGQNKYITREELMTFLNNFEEKIGNKLNDISEKSPQDNQASSGGDGQHGNSAPSATQSQDFTPAGDIQGQVKALSDSLRPVSIAPELKLNETRSHSGIKKQDQNAAKIISKCAYYVETAFKLLGTMQADSISEAQLQNLHVILMGQMEYLQDEYSALYVQGTFPTETVSKFYRNFNKGML